MKKLFITTLLLSSLGSFAKPTADIAILIDTSGSMQSLINQVRDGLWKSLNTLSTLERDGEKSDVRIALLEYGSGEVSAEAGFMRILTPLTSDHTLIAQRLFSLPALGGSEFSGQAIKLATNSLSWSEVQNDFRTIVIAGNETIFQGNIDPLNAASNAFEKDILVNSIYASQRAPLPTNPFPSPGNGCAFCFKNFAQDPIFTEWTNMAHKGGGKSLMIDKSAVQRHIPSPFDEDIIKLTEKINDTFLPFGPSGTSEYNRMRDLDRQVRTSGSGTYMDWGTYRGGNFGRSTQATWDLVSALREGKLDLDNIPNAHLPEKLRGLDKNTKLQVIKATLQARIDLELEIKSLREKRDDFIAEQRRRNQDEDDQSFVKAFTDILKEQLADKNFTL